MGYVGLMWFKGGLWFLLVSVCLCLLRWNNPIVSTVKYSLTIPIPFKRSLLSPLNVSKSLSIILLSHYLLFYLYTLYVPMLLCILFMLPYILLSV